MPEYKYPQHGRFVWYEIVTRDKEKAKKFYGELLGWNFQDEDMGEMGIYPMFGVGEKFLGGMIHPQQENQPASWIAYVGVDDVDATAVKTEELGGKVIFPPTNIPKVGRFCAIADPQGATILPFKFAHDPQPDTDDPLPTGHICWNELLTTDPEAASKFHAGLFGWTITTSDMGEMGTYWLCNRGEKMECGIMKMPPQAEAPPHWLQYVVVEDVDASAARCEELGGKVHCKPTSIPSIGRFAVVADPEGAAFSLFKGEAK